MIGLRKILSVLNLLVLWLAVGALGYFFIFSQVLKSEVVKDWLAADEGYSKITSAIKENLTVSANGASDETVNKALVAITPDLVQKQAEIAVDKYFSYIKGDESAMTLSSKEINDQIFKSININPVDLPLEAQQVIPDFNLPVASNTNYKRAHSFYRLVFVDQPYIIGLIVLLGILMLVLRFDFRDRVTWLLWSVFLPFIGVVVSVFMLGVFKNYFLKNDSLFSSFSVSARAIVYEKIKTFSNLVFNAELQLVIIELTVVAILFALYLVARHFSKQLVSSQPVTPPLVPVASPPASK